MYNIIYPFEVYSSLTFNIFRVMQISPQSLLEHVHYLKKGTSYPLAVAVHSSQAPSVRQPVIYFLSV